MPAYIQPSDLSNLQLWIKADAGIYEDTGGTDAAEDTDGAAYITDHSGNGRHMTQSTSGNRATYRTNQRNGLPVLDFDGSDDYYDSSYTGEPQTVFAVLKVDTASAHKTLLGADTSDATDLGAYYFKPSNPLGSAEFVRSTSSDDLNSAVSQSQTVWMILWGRLTTARSATVGRWHDQATSGLTGSDTSSASLRPITSPVFGCGWYAGNRVDFIDGQVGEVIVYSDEKTDAEVQAIIYYLWRKWGFGLPYASTAEYFMANFEDSAGYHLRVLESVDGTTWYLMPSLYVPTSGHGVRDPSLFIRDSDSWYIAHTYDYPSATTGFDVCTSSDGGLVWTFQKTVDFSSITGIDYCWAPEWFLHADDTLYCIATVSTDSGTSFRCYYTSPSSESSMSGSWASPTEITGLPTSDQIDYYPRYYGGEYFIWFRNRSGGGDYIESYKSSSAFSGYSSHRTGNWMGIGTGYEGPNIFRLNNGTWIHYSDNAAGGFGIEYSVQTAGDWTGSGSTTWDAMADIVIANASYTTRHGSIFYAPPIPPANPRAALYHYRMQGIS